MQFGDGPAAVTGDDRCRHVTDLWLGRRGGRTNRKSEYLPETEQPPPADQGDGIETRRSKGIPGSFLMIRVFFASRRSNPGSMRREPTSHGGDDRMPPEEQLPGSRAQRGNEGANRVAMSGRSSSGIVCRQCRCPDPLFSWIKQQPARLPNRSSPWDPTTPGLPAGNQPLNLHFSGIGTVTVPRKSSGCTPGGIAWTG